MKTLLVALLVLEALVVANSSTPPELNAARLRYADTLKAAIASAASKIVQASVGTSVHLQLSVNTTLDTDVDGLELVEASAHAHLAGLFDAFAQKQADFTDHIVSHGILGESPLDVGYARSMVHNHAHYASILKAAGAAASSSLPGQAFLESGSGFGFGVQVYCGCKLLVSTGSGMGGGFTQLSAKLGLGLGGQVEGGLGGGGGLQIFGNQNQDLNPSLKIGGGGGGDLTGCAGSTDFGQKTPVDSIEKAHQELLKSQIQECPAGSLSVVGGGGGGMGFVVSGLQTNQDPAKNNTGIAAYGGGLNLKFVSAHAHANDAKCNGALLNGDASSDSHKQIHEKTSGCRAKCKGSSKQGLAAFWKCTCPCTQEAFKGLNLTFAGKMTCQ